MSNSQKDPLEVILSSNLDLQKQQCYVTFNKPHQVRFQYVIFGPSSKLEVFSTLIWGKNPGTSVDHKEDSLGIILCLISSFKVHQSRFYQYFLQKNFLFWSKIANSEAFEHTLCTYIFIRQILFVICLGCFDILEKHTDLIKTANFDFYRNSFQNSIF